MIDLKKLQALLQKVPEKKDVPKHVILNLYPLSLKEGSNGKEEFKALMAKLDDFIAFQEEQKIPIFTINLGKKEDIFDQKTLMAYCEKLLEKAISDKINVTVFGRWYDLSGELVETLKRVTAETEDFDNRFLNLCINYDGKQEIADACRVVIRKVISEKQDIDSISPEIIKENIYSSYFIPADLIIEPSNRLLGTFLWDSANAKIVFLEKPVLEIAKSDVEKAVLRSIKKD